MNSNKITYYGAPQTIIAALTATVVVAVCLYGLFVFTIVSKVAARQRAETLITEKTLAVSELEASYLALKSGITKDLVAASGLSTVKSKSYVEKRSLGLSGRRVE